MQHTICHTKECWSSCTNLLSHRYTMIIIHTKYCIMSTTAANQYRLYHNACDTGTFLLMASHSEKPINTQQCLWYEWTLSSVLTNTAKLQSIIQEGYTVNKVKFATCNALYMSYSHCLLKTFVLKCASLKWCFLSAVFIA